MKPFNIRQLFDDRGLSEEERREVLEGLFVFGKSNQTPYLFRMGVLLLLSTIIATAGLLSNSAAVVIGAMLVAPLMNPVMAAAGAVVMGWPRRFYGALALVFIMACCALLLSAIITFASPEVVFIPEQVLARTRPTYYDLVIALAAGSAGAYTITRKESSAIPGVAVAVALLPPLASAGILISAGYHELALRAVILFLVNLIAMVLAGALTFKAVGVSPGRLRKKGVIFARSQILIFLALTAVVSIPLWSYSENIIFNPQYRAAKSEIMQSWLRESQLDLVDVDILRDKGILYLRLEGPNPPVNIGDLHEKIREEMPESEREKFKIRYTWTQKATGVWPQEGQPLQKLTEKAESALTVLAGKSWLWSSTQYNAESTVIPASGESFSLSFDKEGEFEVNAACGRWKGKYSYNGESIIFEMKRNWMSGCRNDKGLQYFLADLARAKAAFINDDRLTVTLQDGKGSIHFER